MGEVGRDDLEMRCRLEGVYDFVHRHRCKEQQETRSAFGYNAAYLLEEVVVNAEVAEVSA
jgi:hypothetical protein